MSMYLNSNSVCRVGVEENYTYILCEKGLAVKSYFII